MWDNFVSLDQLWQEQSLGALPTGLTLSVEADLWL